MKDVENINPTQVESTLLIDDGNATFHCLKQIPSNFREISRTVFNSIPKKYDFIFSTDMYKPNSIKSMERKMRGMSEKLIISGEATRKPADWKFFLENDENKMEFD